MMRWLKVTFVLPPAPVICSRKMFGDDPDEMR